jgi:hypothetical protein
MSRKKQDNEIEQILPDFDHGPKLRAAISRVEPVWCAGYLETIEVYDREDISFATIRDRYGGGKFNIKIMGKKGRYLMHRTAHISGPVLESGVPKKYRLDGGDTGRNQTSNDEMVQYRKYAEVLNKQFVDMMALIDEMKER